MQLVNCLQWKFTFEASESVTTEDLLQLLAVEEIFSRGLCQQLSSHRKEGQ